MGSPAKYLPDADHAQNTVSSGNDLLDDDWVSLKRDISEGEDRTKALLALQQRLSAREFDVRSPADAAQASVPLLDDLCRSADPALGHIVAPEKAIRVGFMVWRKVGDILLVPISDPNQTEAAKALLADRTEHIRFLRAPHSAILGYYAQTHRSALSEAANQACPEDKSFRRWACRNHHVLGAVLLSAFLGLAVASPIALFNLLFAIFFLALLFNSGMKIAALLGFLSRLPPRDPQPLPDKLPKISILLPLLHEADILPRLIRRMEALKYPRDLLEICLVYEANDETTKSHIEKARLPFWFRKIEVPVSTLQTKPRALNYAMDFCTGDVIGIYDAEDAPEPEQLYQVVRRFEEAGPRTACVQARLDYYNTATNWISRCFTIEYAILFRVILPGFERLDLPIPLGGTSVFFLRDKLEALGRWDAHNVTEDADLGMRLYRAGMRCALADATTYEEANYRALPWIRQRSRWLKGFLQTWITHMSTPVRTARQMGLAGFVMLNVLFLGTFLSFFSTPLVLPMWLLSFDLLWPLYGLLTFDLRIWLVTGFVGTELFLASLGAVAMAQRNTREMMIWLPAMLFYWPLGCLAAFKALYELFTAPVYWDKTQHGINDRVYEAEISRLTKDRG